MSTRKLSKVRKSDPYFAREVQKYAIPLPSREYVQMLLADQGKPRSFEQICILLDISAEERELFQRRLNAMMPASLSSTAQMSPSKSERVKSRMHASRGVATRRPWGNRKAW